MLIRSFTRRDMPSRAVKALTVASLALVALIGAGPLAGTATAQQMTEQQMIEALLGKPVRGASDPAATVKSAPTRSIVPSETDRLRNLLEKGKTRAFSAKERTEVAELTAPRPSLDFEVYFPFNSSALQGSAMPTMERIGKILTNTAFTERAFLIAGHTDAKGSAEANQIVSQRRAEAVKDYLVKTYGVDPARLRVIGYGKEQLKDKVQPFSSINRRVQIINLPDGTLTASR